jgi:hypothetical protein
MHRSRTCVSSLTIMFRQIVGFVIGRYAGDKYHGAFADPVATHEYNLVRTPQD